jgi:CxxC motif-containing protein (DUF1111 family)
MGRKLPLILSLLGLQAPLWAQTAPPSEAPAGFDTPTIAQDPGSQSVSNGIVEPPGDSFAFDQTRYERTHDASTGLGPVFNARACSDCHQNPVSGGASQFTELRAGHRDKTTGAFVNPTVPVNDGAATITGRSIVNDRALVPEAQEHIPATENLRELRATLSTLGDGFVEAIDDSTLLAIAAEQPKLSHGRIHGEAIQVPMFEAPGQTRLGRFGWKNQHSSLLSFVADAYVNEMGVTNPLRLSDVTNVGKVTTDPEDKPDALGLADIDHFTQFLRGTKAPPRDATLSATAGAIEGEQVFRRLGCNTCHVQTIVTAKPGTVVNGGKFTVPDALGNKIIHPFSDFLLHDVGTAGGIVQTAAFQDTADKFRTSALWGLRMRPRYMHDLLSLTLENAVLRHRGEATLVTLRFLELSEADKQALFTFLNSL